MSRQVEIQASDRARLVERQMRNWELTRSQRTAGATAPNRQVNDFICISREVGAGGGEIAATVGRKLGWPVFDRELLQLMAGDDVAQKTIYGTLDERDAGWLGSMLQILMDSRFVRDDYFRKLSETVLALVRKGSAVFVGRAVDLILPAGIGLRVRIIAPQQVRLKRVAQREHIDEARAARLINQIEEERTAYIRRHFGAGGVDQMRYDLVINLARMTHDQAANVIIRTHLLIETHRAE